MRNYFNFKRWNDNEYLITNDFGKYAFVNRKTLLEMVGSMSLDEADSVRLTKLGFMVDGDSEETASAIQKEVYRASKAHLFGATSLHIFVLTNRCNAHCLYCQAQDTASNKHGMMSEMTAEKAVDIALSSNSINLNFEFQGGEPFLNFSVLEHIVEYAEIHKGRHNVFFSVVSNLSLLDAEKLTFLESHHVSISTSLDGPQELHEYNRPLNDGRSSYAALTRALRMLNAAGMCAGAIETTTKRSLKTPKEIVDEYIRLGFQSVFIRPLTPLGYAREHWDEIGYTSAEFVKFYKMALEYIIDFAVIGINIREGHAAIFLSKILYDKPQTYMELRSPCGASIGQVAYYYDGNIYTCDEGRMLAEMGNPAFRLGDAYADSYDSLMASPVCKTVAIASTLEAIPGCCDCVYQPYCGTCPVINLAETGNILPLKLNGYKCGVYKGMLDCIFEILHRNDPNEIKILESWC